MKILRNGTSWISIDDLYVFLYSIYVLSRLFVTNYNLNIAEICFMIDNSLKWCILGQHWWLACFSVFCVYFVCLKSIHICFFLGFRMFVIYYKSKYSSDMFYDWKFSEVVHCGSAIMTGISFVQRPSTYVFSLSKSFCKSCIPPEYTNCDNSHFSWSSFVLQLLRATRWCRNIFLIFSKKFHLN